MKYVEKSSKLKELFYATNKSSNPKWKNKEELESYLIKFGGRVKSDRKRRKGFLVCLLQIDLVAEVPMEFAMKVLVLGEFPS